MRPSIRAPRQTKPIDPGVAFTVPAQAQPVIVVTRMITLINHRWNNQHAKEFINRRNAGEELLDAVFAYLDDRGRPFGVHFDVFREDVEGGAPTLRYGWHKGDSQWNNKEVA